MVFRLLCCVNLHIRRRGKSAFRISVVLLQKKIFYRFGIYEVGKQSIGPDASFISKIMLAGTSGAIGGLVGTPADMVNVRMQNDVKLPADQKRK